MIDAADSNYSFNPWMNPKNRPGDGVDPSVALNPAEIVSAVYNTAPQPPPAAISPRFLGYERLPLTIEDVLMIGPAPLMQDSD